MGEQKSEMNPHDKYLRDSLPCGGPAESVKPLSLDLVHNCLKYAQETGEPLPTEFVADLLKEVELLQSYRPSEVFKKQGQALKDHPMAAILERDAVSYILTCQKNKSDPTPIKTICDAYGVTSSTPDRWKKKYRDVAIDNANKAQLDAVLTQWPALYRHFKPKQNTK
jgi:hypothetical protein